MNIEQIAARLTATYEAAGAAQNAPGFAPVIQVRKNQNALRSTGPRTESGKAASSRNSLRHGLTANQTVIPGEDAGEFDQLCANLIDDRKPAGELEIQLTGEIAACMWRLARARRHEADFLERAVDLYKSAAQKLELIIRYIGSIERQLNRAIARLEQTQATRRKTEAAQPAPPAQPAPKLKVMVAGASMPSDFTNLPAEPYFVSSNDSTPVSPAHSTPNHGNAAL